MERWTILVEGKVQGVFFRKTMRDFVHGQQTFFQGEFGVVGTVRNLSDGRVEVICEGDPRDLLRVEDFARQGSQASRVDRVETEKSPITSPSFSDFSITY